MFFLALFKYEAASPLFGGERDNEGQGDPELKGHGSGPLCTGCVPDTLRLRDDWVRPSPALPHLIIRCRTHPLTLHRVVVEPTRRVAPVVLVPHGHQQSAQRRSH